jgi:hypothetical protein
MRVCESEEKGGTNEGHRTVNEAQWSWWESGISGCKLAKYTWVVPATVLFVMRLEAHECVDATL